MINHFLKNQYLRSVGIVGIGTLFAQCITLLVSPILTRLYSPSDFGLAALFIALVASCSPGICGKYEVAVVISKSQSASKKLFGIGLCINLFLSSTIFLLLLISFDSIFSILNPNLKDIILYAPFALFFVGLTNLLIAYANHLKQYKIISLSKVIFALTSAAVGVTFGIFGSSYGLVVASILSGLASCLWLITQYHDRATVAILRWSQRKYVLASRFRDLPCYNAPTALLDGLTLALPIFVLSHFFEESVVGYYALMVRVGMAPVSFLSSSVSQVNLKRVAELVNDGYDLRPYLLKIMVGLSIIILPLTIIFMTKGPWIFAWLFGHDWIVAGEYLKILMPALALKFVASSLSTTLTATGHNKLSAVWKVGAFVISASIYYIVAPNVEAEEMILVFLWTDLIVYGVYLALIWTAAKKPKGYL